MKLKLVEQFPTQHTNENPNIKSIFGWTKLIRELPVNQNED